MGETVQVQADQALPESERFHTLVEVRWSDIDIKDHINHASMVTLLKTARHQWLFDDGAPTRTLESEHVIADLQVSYRTQLRFDDGPLDVAMAIEGVGVADFTISYEVRSAHASTGSPPAVTGTTRLVAFVVDSQCMRKLLVVEREYLQRWRIPVQS